MASTVVTPQMSDKQKDQLKWITAFALSKYTADISDVTALFVPNFGMGGGGIYVKSTEKDASFSVIASHATSNLGPKRANEMTGVVKGKVIFVKDVTGANKQERLNSLWIMFHELGHAVGERVSVKDVSEEYAYKFEYHALTEAYNAQKMAEWGFDKSDIKTYYAGRKGATKQSTQRDTFENLVQ